MFRYSFTALCALLLAQPLLAAPTVSRLTPPSELFSSGQAEPLIARFLPGQRFDLQATVSPEPGQHITAFRFEVDGVPVKAAEGATSLLDDPDKLVKGLPAGTAVVSLRAYANTRPGRHILSVVASQDDGRTVTAKGSFEVAALARGTRPPKNIIILLGDGMGAAHRTAARIMAAGYAQGKARGRLAMDTFPITGMVMTSSLNGIVTDSAPGMSNYVTGNKAANEQEGVFPDDTLDAFDNPRVEYLSEYLHRTRGTSLGLVTTADVFDATPAANAVHTGNRGRGTGIVDQYLDDRQLTGLAVLMGGGRKWFLPNPADTIKPQALNGSQRRKGSDYVLPADIVAGWKAAPGKLDPERDLIADFEAAGFAYAADNRSLRTLADKAPAKLLGLFAYSNMNVALDKIAGRRGHPEVVSDYGFPDQPMLDEMAKVALNVLAKNPKGFVAMIEGASIDKQAHAMDADRWMLEVLEFDRAVKVARDFADTHPDTLVIVTADHECSGAAVIGASKLSDEDLRARAGKGVKELRDQVVGLYEQAGFPRYTLAPDGYPQTTDIDRKMLIGYGANPDRLEAWTTSPQPARDASHPFAGSLPVSSHPYRLHEGSGFSVTGQIPGSSAAHTATDVPLSAYGRGAERFSGVMDNTEVLFRIMGAR